MKTLIPLALVATFFVAVLSLRTSHAQPEAPEKPRKKETCEIKVREGVKLTFEAEVIDDPAERMQSGTGYINYKGRVYTGVFSPPRCILTSGLLEIKGKKIPLDVSGIADPWIKPEELGPKHVHVQELPHTEFQPGPPVRPAPDRIVGEVEVFFIKGGANDHLVHWFFQGEASLRTSVENRDYPAEWQEGGKKIIKLPEGEERQMDPKRQLVITLNKDGGTTVAGKAVDAEKLTAMLKEIARYNAKQDIIIRADKHTPYGEVLRVLNIARDAPLYYISFTTMVP